MFDVPVHIFDSQAVRKADPHGRRAMRRRKRASLEVRRIPSMLERRYGPKYFLCLPHRRHSKLRADDVTR